MHMNFFGNEVDFQNLATVKGSTYVFQNVQKCNFLSMSVFLVFFLFFLNTIKKKNGSIYPCNMFFLMVF